MVRIGITYTSTQSIWFSGANHTAANLYQLFESLGHEVILLNRVLSEDGFWKYALEIPYFRTAHLKDASGFDWLIDMDGLISPETRQRVAARSFVFLRTFLQFTEMDSSVYIETPYRVRNLSGVEEIWCWDILNPECSIPSIQTLFSCPIRRVPFVWKSISTNKVFSNKGDKIIVHVNEKNKENTSSSVLALVAIRELVLQKVLPEGTTYEIHNMEHLKDSKFLKENVYNNIELDKLPISMTTALPINEWADGSVLFSHSRFTPLRISVLNAVCLGMPVIHNSTVLRDLHPQLAAMYYSGNNIKEIITAFESSKKSWFLSQYEYGLAIEKQFGINAKKDQWKTLVESLTTVATKETPIVISSMNLDKVVIAFSDMWPGFYPDSNFIIDTLRREWSVPVSGMLYDSSVEHHLLIFGPYGNAWKQIPGPKIHFSAENWKQPDDPSIQLFLTCSPLEDKRHLRIPTWMTFIDWYTDKKELPTEVEYNPIRLPLHFAMTSHPVPFDKREHFCGFVVSNGICTFRNDTFQAINTYKRVDSGGALFNNIGGQLTLKYPGGGCGDISKHHFFADRKFTISFENSQAPGYITEKVLHAKMAGCVPLYWGDSNTDNDFAPNSLINLSSTKDPKMVLEVLKKLEANPTVCAQIAATPILNEEKKEKAMGILREMAQRIYQLLPRSDVIGLDRIAKTFCINLDTRLDRWNKLMEAQPELLPITTRQSGVNGKTLKLTQEIYQLFECNQFQWKKSIMGCNLSHITLWRTIAQQTSGEYFLVLEDDVRFQPEWMKKWAEYARDIPTDAELLYLGGVLPPNKPALPNALQTVNAHWSSIKPNTYFSPFPTTVFHFCAYSYILTRKGAQKLVDFMSSSDKRSFTVSDHLLGHPSIGLVKYIATPLLSHCFQEDDPVYVQSQFNQIHREDTFDSDIWNNKECFTEEDLAPFRDTKLSMYYVGANDCNPYETEWLEEMFQKKIIYKQLPPQLQCEDFEQNSWFIVQRPHVPMYQHFFQQLEHFKLPFNVMHISDEFGKDPIDFYSFSMCKKVVRNYLREDTVTLSNVVTIPLGYHHRGDSKKKNSERKWKWSFHGTNWFERDKQLESLRAYEPYNCKLQPVWNHTSATPAAEYNSILENTKFCPILRGQNAETFRLYEAFEAGCLPITTITDKVYLDWIEKHMGLCALYDWANPAKVLSDDSNRDAIQEEVQKRWTAWKKKIQEEIKTEIK